mmetsp:Transcript_28449/g.80862  ORF Transcript_28449/g.80862 Transcript_28449/m.80862 type:complete len:291 (-) Transcript_28449:407-1279(-)
MLLPDLPLRQHQWLLPELPATLAPLEQGAGFGRRWRNARRRRRRLLLGLGLLVRHNLLIEKLHLLGEVHHHALQAVDLLHQAKNLAVHCDIIRDVLQAEALVACDQGVEGLDRIEGVLAKQVPHRRTDLVNTNEAESVALDVLGGAVRLHHTMPILVPVRRHATFRPVLHDRSGVLRFCCLGRCRLCRRRRRWLRRRRCRGRCSRGLRCRAGRQPTGGAHALEVRSHKRCRRARIRSPQLVRPVRDRGPQRRRRLSSRSGGRRSRLLCLGRHGCGLRRNGWRIRRWRWRR